MIHGEVRESRVARDGSWLHRNATVLGLLHRERGEAGANGVFVPTPEACAAVGLEGLACAPGKVCL